MVKTWSRFEDERQEGEHNSWCRVPKDRPEVPRFADVPSAQGRWRWRRTVLEVSGVWGLGAFELHGGGESMRGMNRVGDDVEETVGWDNRRRLCSPVAQSAPRHAITRTLLVQRRRSFRRFRARGFSNRFVIPAAASRISSGTLRYRFPRRSSTVVHVFFGEYDGW